MKKIVAFALALIMVLSMGVVALAVTDYDADHDVALEDVAQNGVAPGESFVIDTLDQDEEGDAKREWKVTYNFTTSTYGWKGASLVDSVVIEKDGDLVLTLNEALTLITANPARVLDKNGVKGAVVPGADADFVIYGQDFSVASVVAKGERAVWEGQHLIRGRFEA